MVDGREYSLIEVEREDRALSMLAIEPKNKVNWKLVYSLLLYGLVDESGKWCNEVIWDLEKENIMIIRKKHSRNNFNNITGKYV